MPRGNRGLSLEQLRELARHGAEQTLSAYAPRSSPSNEPFPNSRSLVDDALFGAPSQALADAHGPCRRRRVRRFPNE